MSVTLSMSDETDPLVGTGMAEDFDSTCRALGDGDWLEAHLHGFGLGLGAAGAVMDPVAAVTAVGMGWAMEHIDPLRQMLDDLAGDPGEVMADSALLERLSDQVGAVAVEIRDASRHHLAQMEGATADACDLFVRRARRDVILVSGALQATSAAMRLAAGAVDGVRTLVRDAISEVVGMVVSAAFVVASTAGLGATVAFAKYLPRISALMLRLGDTLKGLARSFQALRQLLKHANSEIETLIGGARAYRPRHVIPDSELPVTMRDELGKRLQSIRPLFIGLETAPGALATVVAGHEE